MVKTQQVLLAVLWLRLHWVSGKNDVEQSPRYLSALEGDFVTINCSYSEEMTTLQWFQQNPGRGVVSLFILSLEMKKKGRGAAPGPGSQLLCNVKLTTPGGSPGVLGVEASEPGDTAEESSTSKQFLSPSSKTKTPALDSQFEPVLKGSRAREQQGQGWGRFQAEDPGSQAIDQLEEIKQGKIQGTVKCCCFHDLERLV
ncbi:hypothetical protein EI555_021427 [Monodon monoceros]|uniref:Immunoglobulin V-set domain-containing protein n=1 Tax=Monodon monoceros TaxID=40151 RepID=A0A4U1ETD2_MONMO|nr:hypothetical protein EI555_021427 [Monodon monoceros]